MNFLARMWRTRWFRIPLTLSALVLFAGVSIAWIGILNYYESLTPPQFSVWTTEERDDFGFTSIDPISFHPIDLFSLQGSPLVFCSFILTTTNIAPKSKTLCAMAVVDLDRAKRIFYAEWTNTTVPKSPSSIIQEWNHLFIRNAFTVDGHPFIQLRKKREQLSPLLPPAISVWIPFIHPIYTRNFLFDTQGNAQAISEDSTLVIPRGYATNATLSPDPMRKTETRPQSVDLIEYQAKGLHRDIISTVKNLVINRPSFPRKIAEHCYLIADDQNRDFYLVQTQPPLARRFNFSDVFQMTNSIDSITQSTPCHSLTLPTDPFPLFCLSSLGYPVFRIHFDRLEKGEVRDIFELTGENYTLKPFVAMRNNQVLLFDNADRYYRREEPNLELWMSEREDRFSQTGRFPPPKKIYTFLTKAQRYEVLDSERLLVSIDSAIWTIRWDGTDLKQVFPRVNKED